MKEELDTRRWQIIRRVAEGQLIKQIAAQVYLSPRTLEKILGRIYHEVGVADRAELAAWYWQKIGDSQNQERIRAYEQEIVELYRNELQRLDKLHIEGEPRLVLDDINSLIVKLREHAVSSNFERWRLEFLRDVLFAKAWAKCAMAEPGEFYVGDRTFGKGIPLIHELRDIGRELNDRECLLKADYLLADAHYIAGDYLSSIRLLPGIVENVNDRFYQIHARRLLAANYSHLPNREKYRTEFDREVYKKIPKLMDSELMSNERKVLISVASLVRSMARFGDIDEAFTLLQKGKRQLEGQEVQRQTLRVMSMGVAELYVNKVSRTGHPDDWKKEAQRLIGLDMEHQYPRPVAELRSYLHFL